MFNKYFAQHTEVYICTLCSLPVQSAGGEMVVAEATLKGKKKEAVTQCALEACRLLDSYGMLRQASQGKYFMMCSHIHTPVYIYDSFAYKDSVFVEHTL